MQKISLRAKNNEHPSNRLGAASFVYKGYIYCFGGQNSKIDKTYGDLWKISLETFEVEKINYGTVKLKRDGHCFYEYNGDFYLFGGYDGEIENSDMYKNFQKLELEVVPSPRCYFASVLYNDSIYVYGGESDNGVLNDLWKFDLKKKEWLNLGQYNHRACHSACVVNDKMYVYGGFYDKLWFNTVDEYNFKTGKWKPFLRNPKLPILGGYSMISFNHKIFIFEGYNGNNLTGNLLCICPFTQNFRGGKIKDYGLKGGCDKSIVEYRRKFYIIGGETDQTLELYEFDSKNQPPLKISSNYFDCIIFTENDEFKNGKRKREEENDHIYKTKVKKDDECIEMKERDSNGYKRLQ